MLIITTIGLIDQWLFVVSIACCNFFDYDEPTSNGTKYAQSQNMGFYGSQNWFQYAGTDSCIKAGFAIRRKTSQIQLFNIFAKLFDFALSNKPEAKCFDSPSSIARARYYYFMWSKKSLFGIVFEKVLCQ